MPAKIVFLITPQVFLLNNVSLDENTIMRIKDITQESQMKIINFITAIIMILLTSTIHAQGMLQYKIVDTGQTKCYNNVQEIIPPRQDDDFYGQDAQFNGFQPSYTDNGDNTITDNITGLMWQKSLPDDKYTYEQCVHYADSCTLAGYTDWRLPTIKELYSLILFSGKTGMSEQSSIPYLDTDYFDFRFGGTVNPNERHIDAQYATCTLYKGTTMGGNETMFGVNFVDGRIKGYPTSKDFEIKLVRGRRDYGINQFVDNGDGTITDHATGLMWEKAGSSNGMDWEDALALVQQRNNSNYLGYNDWRLPNAKELQSIVDYERSPTYTNSPAISPLFDVPTITDEGGSVNYPFYWTSTTHDDGLAPDKAVYICFGEALGFMEMPPNSGNYFLQDVHGAGAQRSDPKEGDPDDYPYGHGPQGDVIRIYNYVRLVRDANATTGVGDHGDSSPQEFVLGQNVPNPFNQSTTISISLPAANNVSLKIYDLCGRLIKTLLQGRLSAGTHSVHWQAKNCSSGIYYCVLKSGSFSEVKRMILLK
jgi:hypothetical protein